MRPMVVYFYYLLLNTEVHSYETFQNDRASALLHASAADRGLRRVPQTRPLGRAGGDFYPCRYRNAGADGHARTHADRDARADVHEPADR